MRATSLAASVLPRWPHRAQRYPLQLPVRYRLAGESRWHTGLTENISESGASIRADEALVPHSRVTLVIALPAGEIAPGGWLIGEGTVVRNANAGTATASATFAVIAAFALASREDVTALTSH